MPSMGGGPPGPLARSEERFPLDLLEPEESFREAIRGAVERAFGLRLGEVAVTYPPTAELGDLATPVCFDLARTLRRSPREIAARVAETIVAGSGIARVEAAGAGYLNAYLDRDGLIRDWLTGPRTPAVPTDERKVVVEHTNINPNKAAHIGHLRNAVLGDTLVRVLERLGHRVETQNYIDDTGVQVADLVVGFEVLRNEKLETVLERYAESALRQRGQRFDYVAWDLYAEVTRYYEQDRSHLEHRQRVLLAMERGEGPTAALAAHIAQRMVQYHLTTMARIGVRYDLLPRESDILQLRFWEDAFRLLRESGALRLSDSGRTAGCWVMDLPGIEEGAGEDQKIIVRSNGTVTYVGKDIAYQLWKFGLLARDFRYRRFDWAPLDARYDVWSTCSDDGVSDHPPFGHAAAVYNVIDTRQSYLQRVVVLGLRALGHAEQAQRSIHYAYDMVALSPAAVGELFPDQPLTDEDLARPHLEMSGRRGIGVRADDLIDRLIERATGEVRERNPSLDGATVAATAHEIAVGALRYYMLRFTRNRVVAFDLDAALAFEGETGPYLQYSVVRARNILARLSDRHGREAASRSGLAREVDLACLARDTVAEHWNLVLQLSRIPGVMRQAIETLELSMVAKHAHGLAQAFNSFYHRHPVVQEADPRVRSLRTALVVLYHDGMVDLLDAMGLAVPDRM